MKYIIVIIACFSVLFSCVKHRDIPYKYNDQAAHLNADTIKPGILVINEFTPKGKVDTNEFNNLGKWFEIYNLSDKDRVIDTNFFITDSLGWPDKFQVKLMGQQPIIPARGFLVVWCDNNDTIPNNKHIHTSFSLSSAGGDIGLSYRNSGGHLFFVDSTKYSDYSLAVKGISIGRFPDGTNGFKQLLMRTPDKPNEY